MLNKFMFLFIFAWAGIGFSQDFKHQDKFSGTMEVLVEDYFNESLSKTKYYLNFIDDNKENKNVEVLFEQTLLEDLLTGDKVLLSGYLLQKNKIQVLGWKLLSRADPIKTAANETRRAVYFRVNVADLNATFTEEQIVQKMQKTSEWYRNATYGQMNFPVDVDGNGDPDVYTVTIDRTAAQGCDATDILNKTRATAIANGVDMSLYQHTVMVLPDLRCGWGGLGHLGCSGTCASWIASPAWDLVYPHELGHNIGMHHAGTDTNEDDAVESQYGDGSCPMGNIIPSGHFNGPHTWQMNWLTEDSGNVVTVEETGSFDLYSLATDPNQGKTQLLRIARTDSPYFYYLSYRPGNNFDQVQGKYKTGVSIHSFEGGARLTRYHRTLADGDTWNANSVRVVQTSKTADYVRVTVQKDCLETYTMGMTPPVTTVYPQRPAAFAVELVNTSASECEPAQISLAAVLPEGFAASFEQDVVTLNPGETKTVAMELSTTLFEGQFGITVNSSSAASGEQAVKTSQVFVQRGGLGIDPGLVLNHYNGMWSKLPNFDELESDVESIVDVISVGEYAGKGNFGLVFTGLINIEVEGNYDFSTTSDDGSKLFIDGSLFVDNDGLHGAQKVTQSGFFTAGFHPIKVEFFERGGGEVVTLHWKKEGGIESEVPASALFHYVPNEDVPPVVSEGRELTAKLNHKVILRGSAQDPDGYIVTAGWTLIEAPAGAVPMRAASSKVHTRHVFKAEQLGVYRFEFFAVDDSDLRSSSVTTVTIVE